MSCEPGLKVVPPILSRGPSPQSTGEMQSTNGCSGPAVNGLNSEWQVWSSRSTTPLRRAVSSGRGPVNTASGMATVFGEGKINVGHDGWTTTSSFTPSLDLPERTAFTTADTMERPSVALATQWFSQPSTRSEPNSGIMPDARLAHAPASPAKVSPVYPAPQQSLPFESFRGSPSTEQIHRAQFRPTLGEDDRYNRSLAPHVSPGLHAPMPPVPIIPFAPLQMPGTGAYNPYAYSPSEYGSYVFVQSPEPFTEYGFAFDAFGHAFGQPPFPMHPPPGMGSRGSILYTTPPILSAHEHAPHPHALPNPFDMPSVPPFLFQPPVPSAPHSHIPINNTLTQNHGPNIRPVTHDVPSTISRSPNGPAQPRHLQMTNRAYHQPQFKRSNGWIPGPGQLSPQSSCRPRRQIPINMQLGARPSIVESFRISNKDKQWTLDEITGHVVEFSADQYGSRFIQQQLDEVGTEDRQRVFEEIVPLKTDQLIRDVFGNYVIQKFFDVGTRPQKDDLARVVEADVVGLSLHIYGCRVVQKAIEHMSKEQQSRVIQILDRHINTCIKDPHGNHVIQKLVEYISPDRLTFLHTISLNIKELATHTYGCRVLQRCLEHLSGQYTRMLLDSILGCAIDLMENQYGNYVIQFILDKGQECDRVRVISQIRGSLIKLAQHKYASNVCEKALVSADSENRARMIQEIMDSPTEKNNPIITMVKDQYANYVLQRALSVSEGEQKEQFYSQVRPLLSDVRKLQTTYSKPLAALERLMDKHFGKQERSSQGTEAHSAQTSRM